MPSPTSLIPLLVPRPIVHAHRAIGARAPGATSSPQFRDGTFHNREPMQVVESGSRRSIALEFATKRDRGRPRGTVPLVRPQWPEPAAACAATWLGHATVLLEVGGHRVLTDPVWSERVSPSAHVGPRRHHPVPAPIESLPRLDAVLISHDHYDHLDTATIDRLVALQDVPFVVPLGVGAHLRAWGVPAARVVELDWEQSVELDGLRLTCTPARHFSGRLFRSNLTLWSSWLVESGGRRAFFGGDTGYSADFAELGRRHGPVDLTVLPIGAYDVRWPDVHLDPAEAVRVHRELRGDVMLPIHWGTFDLAFHTWAAPADWARSEAETHGVRLAQPRPGERVDVGAVLAGSGGLPTDEWWRDLG